MPRGKCSAAPHPEIWWGYIRYEFTNVCGQGNFNGMITAHCSQPDLQGKTKGLEKEGLGEEERLMKWEGENTEIQIEETEDEWFYKFSMQKQKGGG